MMATQGRFFRHVCPQCGLRFTNDKKHLCPTAAPAVLQTGAEVYPATSFVPPGPAGERAVSFVDETEP